MLQFCHVPLGGYLFGIEVVKVQEVLRYQRMTPGARWRRRRSRGLINLRGQIVTAARPAGRLGLPPAPRRPAAHERRRAHAARAPLSLLVDEIGDVIEVAEDASSAPPATLVGPGPPARARAPTSSTDRLLLVLDTERAVAVETPAAA